MSIYRLARPDLKIPMPDRGCRLFGDGGETVDPTNPYYVRLIADGDIVAEAADGDVIADAADKKAARSAGRRMGGGTADVFRDRYWTPRSFRS